MLICVCSSLRACVCVGALSQVYHAAPPTAAGLRPSLSGSLALGQEGAAASSAALLLQRTLNAAPGSEDDLGAPAPLRAYQLQADAQGTGQ